MRITTMTGAGNDFVVVGPDAAALLGPEPGDWVRRVCRRGLSVGSDGVLFVTPAGPGRVAVRFLNPDGSEAFCGNGSRCAARYAVREGLAGPSLTLLTAAGEVPAEVRGERVRLTLAPPRRVDRLELVAGGDRVTGAWVEAGCPHLIVTVPDVAAVPLERWGPAWRRDPRLGPGGANVDVLSRDGDVWRLRTWERGVEGETLACGSGAVAAALVARDAGAGERVDLVPTGGVPLRVELPGPADAPSRAVLEGDARFLLDGELNGEATCGF